MNKYKPWEETDIWRNESEYLTWLRGKLRQIWGDWPLKNEFKDSVCVRVTPHMRDKYNLHRATKKAAQCGLCGEWFAKSHLDVDHVVEAGSMVTQDMVAGFLERLLCSKENMRVVCRPCHKIHTYSTKSGLSFEDAAIEKAVIQWTKDYDTTEQKNILILAGFKDSEIGNAKSRRDSARKLLTNSKIGD